MSVATRSADSRPHLAVIGNGMAATRTVEELLQLAPDRYRITMFGAEPHGSYNRILLSPVLAGEKRFDDIVTHPPPWYAERGIELRRADPVVRIDRARRLLHAAGGAVAHYDRLLLATGSLSAPLQVPGCELPGVLGFRDLTDVEIMLAAARGRGRAVVIGGGLLGLEAASALTMRGMQVTVVHAAPRLLNRQLDAAAAALLRRELERRGIALRLETTTAALSGDARVRCVHLADGSELRADLVVVAIGIRPNVTLARDAGLHCERAVVVDDALQTLSDPRVYAVGECVQHRGATFGLVAPVWEQARVCAAHLAGLGVRRYVQSTQAARLKVTGIEVFSAGDFDSPGGEDLVFRDPARGVYKRIVIARDRIRGAVLYGDARDGSWYFDLMQQQTDVRPFREQLLFGKAFARAA